MATAAPAPVSAADPVLAVGLADLDALALLAGVAVAACAASPAAAVGSAVSVPAVGLADLDALALGRTRVPFEALAARDRVAVVLHEAADLVAAARRCAARVGLDVLTDVDRRRSDVGFHSVIDGPHVRGRPVVRGVGHVLRPDRVVEVDRVLGRLGRVDRIDSVAAAAPGVLHVLDGVRSLHADAAARDQRHV